MSDKQRAEVYVPVDALAPLLKGWKDWCASSSPDAQVRAVNNGIQQGLDFAHDDLLKVLSEASGVNMVDVRARNAILRRALDEANEDVARLRQALDEVNDEVRSLKEQAKANAQVMKGEQDTITRALDHLDKIYRAAADADQDFNFSGNYDPDV